MFGENLVSDPRTLRDNCARALFKARIPSNGSCIIGTASRAVQYYLHNMESELLQRCILCDSTKLDVLDLDCNIAQCGACGYIFDNP